MKLATLITFRTLVPRRLITLTPALLFVALSCGSPELTPPPPDIAQDHHKAHRISPALLTNTATI